MKIIKFAHSFFGIIPFIWFSCFLLILTIGIVHFGYVPKEGNPVDPYKLGLDWLSIIITIFSFIAYISFYLWILISIIILLKREKLFNKISTILFIIGVSGFFIFKYLFPEVFGWVLD